MNIFKDECLECGELMPVARTGRPRNFCSNACRQRNYRNSAKRRAELRGPVDPIPSVLRDRARWILHRAKRPIALGGWWSSFLDSSTWLSYAEAVSAAKRADVDGVGFVLNGDGIVCIDLDDCVVDGVPNVFAREFINALGNSYVEFSPSGRGLHVWGYSDIPKGQVIKTGTLKIEVYPSKRFITMTGRVYREGALGELHISNALRLVA